MSKHHRLGDAYDSGYKNNYWKTLRQ